MRAPGPQKGMSADFLHRIRWANVARAAAILLALALAIGWPRLRPQADPLPPAVAAPALPDRAATTELAGVGPARTEAPVTRAQPRRRGAAHGRTRASATRPRARRARAPRHRHAAPRVQRPRAAPAAAPPSTRAPALPASAPVAAVPPPAPAGLEFRP